VQLSMVVIVLLSLISDLVICVYLSRVPA
jgi:hypothetical protein